MLIVKIVTTLLVVSLTPFIMVRDWRFGDRRTSKHHLITRGIVILWGIGCLGSALLIWSETLASNRLAMQIDDLIIANTSLKSEVAHKTEKIIELAETNVALSANLIGLSEQNVALVNSERDLITGGKLYCTFFPNNRTNEVFDLQLGIQGSHAHGPSPVLRDVTVYVTRPSSSAALSAIDTPYRVRAWTRDNGRSTTDELFFQALHLELVQASVGGISLARIEV